MTGFYAAWTSPSGIEDASIIILPLANHDNNQHGRDENLRLQNLWDAIEIYAAVLTGL